MSDRHGPDYDPIDDLSIEDIDALFGRRIERQRYGFSPQPPNDDDDELLLEEIPDAATLAGDQRRSSLARLDLDTRKYPRFGWHDLDKIVGQTIPGDVVIVGAQPGSGKSLFVRNWWDHLIFVQQKQGTYLGLEDSPEHCRIKWACDRTDIPSKLVLGPPEHVFGSPIHREAKRIIAEQLKLFDTPMWRPLHHFATARHVTAAVLEQWIRWSAEQGATFVIVDHIDRVDVGPGRNSADEMRRMVVKCKELAEELKIVVILVSQVKRPEQRTLSLAPPSLEDLAGSSSKERESSIVLALWRMLRPEVGTKEINRVRMGVAGCDIASLWEPGAMGVRVLKHRLDGDGFGKQVRLRVRGSKIVDWKDGVPGIKPCWHCGTPLTVAEQVGWGVCDACFHTINVAA